MTDNRAIELYDEIVSRHTTPQALDIIRKLWLEERLEAYTDGWVFDIDPEQLALQEFRLTVEPIRDSRSTRLGQDIDYLLDGFQEDGDYVDPLLSQAHRIGDGTDLTLRLWGIEEWKTWAYGRMAIAVKTAAAADRDRLRAESIIDRMNQENVSYTGDLNFTRRHESAE